MPQVKTITTKIAVTIFDHCFDIFMTTLHAKIFLKEIFWHFRGRRDQVINELKSNATGVII